jgi:hypothetical protein
MHTGWLLDDGVCCLGVTQSGTLGIVTYNDINALRFAREYDAQIFRNLLPSFGLPKTAHSFSPRQQQWT